MHWDETSLFIHLKLTGTSTRSRSAPNPRNVLKRDTSIQQDEQAQETQGSVTGIQPHTFEVYVSVEVPTKGGLLHLGHFHPSRDHKDQARFTYSISG
jgi:hypothetical protein